MAIRFLFYLADLYSGLLKDYNLFGTKRIMIPPTKFIVFYNGVDERPDQEIHKLSDSYIIQEEPISLELLVEVFNINKGHNRELMEACKDLADYAEYTYRVRKYAKEMPIEDAVERTINECIEEGILKDFLLQNRAEAKKMSIYEYNEEEHMRMERRDAYEDGLADGRKEGLAAGRLESLLELLNDLGEIPPEIVERARLLDADTLKQWRRHAARADSIEEFLAQVK